MVKKQILVFGGILGIALMLYFYLRVPMACESLVDSQISEVVGKRLALEDLQMWIQNRYSLNLGELEQIQQAGVTLLRWERDGSKYLLNYLNSEVKNVWVFRTGIFSRFPNGLDLIRCFGNPEYSRAELIRSETAQLNYQHWYVTQGFAFEGKVPANTAQNLRLSDSDDFDGYVVFKVASLSEAVEDVYVGYPQSYQEEWLKNLQIWTGSWETIKVQIPSN